MRSDTRVKTHTVDNLLRIQPLAFCVGIQLIKIGNTKGEIGICEQLHRFSFGEAHKQSINIFFFRSLLQERSKDMSFFCGLFITGNNDTAWIEIIIKCLGFTEKFRAKDDILCIIFFSYRCSIANRNGGFDNHHGIGIAFQYQFNHGFYSRAIKEVFLAVIVGRSSNNDEICISISRNRICGCMET